MSELSQAIEKVDGGGIIEFKPVQDVVYKTVSDIELSPKNALKPFGTDKKGTYVLMLSGTMGFRYNSEKWKAKIVSGIDYDASSPMKYHTGDGIALSEEPNINNKTVGFTFSTSDSEAIRIRLTDNFQLYGTDWSGKIYEVNFNK